MIVYAAAESPHTCGDMEYVCSGDGDAVLIHRYRQECNFDVECHRFENEAVFTRARPFCEQLTFVLLELWRESMNWVRMWVSKMKRRGSKEEEEEEKVDSRNPTFRTPSFVCSQKRRALTRMEQSSCGWTGAF
jgi:hypothetical protein